MNSTKRTFLRAALACAIGCAVMFIGNPTAQEIVSTASARVGRPMTPMSYAGVARRTTRRTVAAGAAVAGTAAYGYSGSNCVQQADAYGRLYTRCY